MTKKAKRKRERAGQVATGRNGKTQDGSSSKRANGSNGSNGANGRVYSPEFIAAQWQPGQSGNPAGRPRRKTFEDWVADVIDEQIEVPGPDGTTVQATRHEMMARVMVDMMVVGRNSSVFKEYMARAWPAVSRVDLRTNATREQLEDQLLDELAYAADQLDTDSDHGGPVDRSNGGGE